MKVRINYDTPIEIRDIKDLGSFLNILISGRNTIKEVRIEMETATEYESDSIVTSMAGVDRGRVPQHEI